MQVNLTSFSEKENCLNFYAKKIIPNNELKILKKYGHSEPFLIIGKWQFGCKFCFNSISVNINDQDEIEEYIDKSEVDNDNIDQWEEEVDFITTIDINSFKDWQYLINTGQWYIEDSEGNNYSLEKFTDFVNSKQNGKPELQIKMQYVNFSWSSQEIYGEPFDEEGYWFPSLKDLI